MASIQHEMNDMKVKANQMNNQMADAEEEGTAMEGAEPADEENRYENDLLLLSIRNKL